MYILINITNIWSNTGNGYGPAFLIFFHRQAFDRPLPRLLIVCLATKQNESFWALFSCVCVCGLAGGKKKETVHFTEFFSAVDERKWTAWFFFSRPDSLHDVWHLRFCILQMLQNYFVKTILKTICGHDRFRLGWKKLAQEFSEVNLRTNLYKKNG